MDSKNVPVADVQVAIGETFELHLYSSGGSTEYLWYLSEMPQGLIFISTTSALVSPTMPKGQMRQSFTFVATGTVKGPVSFELLRIWAPTRSADTRSYTILVGEINEESF